jgi:hypothetical protein
MGDHRTEAACLLETGTAFPSRIGLRLNDHELVFAGLKPEGLSIYYGDEPIFHFDPEGRWRHAFVSGVHYYKGLDSTTTAVDRTREGVNLVLKRRILSYVETTEFDDRVRKTAIDLLEAIESKRVDSASPPVGVETLDLGELAKVLNKAVRWDSAAWFAQRERYREQFGELPFLPPGSERSIVLEATIGHPNGVGFGGSIVSEHRVRSVSEFQTHVERVAQIWGERAFHAKSIYLAGGGVLTRPFGDVIEYLEAIAATFPFAERPDDQTSVERNRGVVRCFIDDFSGEIPNQDQLALYCEKGLDRVDIGMISGDRSIRSVFGRNWADSSFDSFFKSVKAAGIPLGILFLLGAGGKERSADHVRSIFETIERIEPSEGDFVFLLDLEEVGGESAIARLREAGLVHTGRGDRIDEQKQIKTALLDQTKRRGFKIVPYGMEKQMNRY